MTKIYYNVKSNNIEKAHGVAAIITDSGSVDLGSNPGGPVFYTDSEDKIPSSVISNTPSISPKTGESNILITLFSPRDFLK